jgi:2-C-methyl-D-erythritol 2,4-cyclodiphosphate synthase
VGLGYDIHRLEPLEPEGRGKPFLLAGVRLQHDRGPVAHSDGDALYHVVTDAILGAAGLPDIGQYFPDTAPENESIDSGVILGEAVRRAREAGWAIGNVDAIVILQTPKIAGLKMQMRENLALRLGVPLDRVNVKGRTKEEMDTVGQGLAVETQAAVLLIRASEHSR